MLLLDLWICFLDEMKFISGNVEIRIVWFSSIIGFFKFNDIWRILVEGFECDKMRGVGGISDIIILEYWYCYSIVVVIRRSGRLVC